MKQKDLLIILVSLFVLTVLWVVFNIYHSFVTSTIKDSLSIQIVPIEGQFDTNTINQIRERRRVEPLYEIGLQISGAPAPTPEVSTNSAELSSESAEFSPTNTPEEDQ